MRHRSMDHAGSWPRCPAARRPGGGRLRMVSVRVRPTSVGSGRRRSGSRHRRRSRGTTVRGCRGGRPDRRRWLAGSAVAGRRWRPRSTPAARYRRAVSVRRFAGDEATVAEAGESGVEVGLRPAPAAVVALARHPVVHLGHQADLDGVEPGRDPRRDVRVAAVLADRCRRRATAPPRACAGCPSERRPA